MNPLMSIDFQGLNTSEALFDPKMADAVRRCRVTRCGMGELFGAQHPQKYIDNLVERNPSLPQGLTLTVRATDGKNYTTFTYDLFDVYPYAIAASLPGAKRFLKQYPTFLHALYTGQIKAAPMASKKLIDARDQILALDLISDARKRGQAVRELAEAVGASYQTINRHRRRLRAGENIEFKKPDRSKFYAKRLPVYQAIWRLSDTGMKQTDIAKETGVSIKTVNRTLKRRPIHQ